MRTLALAAVAGMLVLAGCAGAHRVTGGPRVQAGAPRVSGPQASPRPAAPYSLYTHCGISGALIDGRWYQAWPPLSDGSDNPPPGWGNPYQRGTIRMISSTEAVFSDPERHHVRFVLRPGATGPVRLCA